MTDSMGFSQIVRHDGQDFFAPANVRFGRGASRALRVQELRLAAKLLPLEKQIDEDGCLRSKNVGFERLDQVIDAMFVATGNRRSVVMRREEDDRNMSVARQSLDAPRGLEAVHSGHSNVHQDHGVLTIDATALRLLA
jgi:hypothetical protein